MHRLGTVHRQWLQELLSPLQREKRYGLWMGQCRLGLREDSVLQGVWLDPSCFWWSWQQGEESHALPLQRSATSALSPHLKSLSVNSDFSIQVSS